MNGQKRFAALKEHRDQIDHALGEDLIWENPEDQKKCRIYRRKLWDYRDEDTWPEIRKWLKSNVEQFHKVLVPSIQGLDHSAFKE